MGVVDAQWLEDWNLDDMLYPGEQFTIYSRLSGRGTYDVSVVCSDNLR